MMVNMTKLIFVSYTAAIWASGFGLGSFVRGLFELR